MDDAILHSDLDLLEVIDQQIEFIEGKIDTLASENPRVRLLMTMRGIGYFTAMLLLSEIVDIDRFSSDKRLAAWAGLASSVRQSGEKIRVGGVGEPGNRKVRWVMVVCSHCAAA